MFESVFYHVMSLFGRCSVCGIRAVNDSLEVMDPTLILYPFVCGPNNHTVCQNCAGLSNVHCCECDTRRDLWLPQPMPIVTRVFVSLNRFNPMFKCPARDCSYKSNIYNVVLHVIRCCLFRNSICIGCNIESNLLNIWEHLESCSLYNLLPSTQIDLPNNYQNHTLVQNFDIGILKRKFTFDTETGRVTMGFAVNMHETDPPLGQVTNENFSRPFTITIRYFAHFPDDVESYVVDGFVYNNSSAFDNSNYLSLNFRVNSNYLNIHASTIRAVFDWRSHHELAMSFRLRRIRE